jgi:PAS domain S-box-containing protein
MTLSDEFYACLRDIFHQVALDPGTSVHIPMDRWEAGSPEVRILADIEESFLKLKRYNQDNLAAIEQKGLLYQSVFESNCNGVIISDIETGRVVELNPTAASMLGYECDELVGMPVTTYIHPDSLPAWSRCLATVRGGGVFNGNLIHVRKDGSKLEIDQNGAEIFYQDKPCLLTVLRDISKLIEHDKSEKLLQQGVKVRTHELSTLLDISHALSSTLDIDPDLILDQLRKIVAYTQACLFTVEESSLVALAVRGSRRLEQFIPMEIGLDGPEILKILFNEHQTTRIDEVYSSEPTAIFLRSLMKNKAAVLLEEVHSWMWVPLVVKDRILGGLGIAHVLPHYFTRHHADLVQTAANQAAITMANAELYENARMFAVLQERQRLSRNLHDAVNQSLFSANLIAEVLPRLWEQNQEEAKHSLQDLRRLTNGAMAEMRMMMAELRPMALTDASINDLFCLLGDAFTGRTGIPIHINVLGAFTFPTDVQIVLYRLCQEGLNNISRHSQATQAEIILQHLDGLVNLLISDNGIGFDTTQIRPGHFGLNMMKERAESIGASFLVNSQVGSGTQIDIRWAENPEWKNNDE